mgnify:CR=1 FL=1
MSEIKINTSNVMDESIQEVTDSLGIKKTEFVKSLVIENLKEMKEGKK